MNCDAKVPNSVLEYVRSATLAAQHYDGADAARLRAPSGPLIRGPVMPR